MLFSVLGFTLMAIILRYLPNIPIYEKVFFRNLVNCLTAVFLLIKMKQSIKIKKKYMKFVFGRSFFGFVGMVANFYALEHLTIADANMLNKLSPVFVTICACLFLKEKVDKKQILGIIMMLIAIIFVIRPSFNPEVIPSLVGLSSAILAGFSYTIIRYLNIDGKVKSEVIVFCFTLFSVICTLPFMIMNFVKPTPMELLLLIGIGLTAAMGQFGLTYAYTYAPASEVSVYNYTIIVSGLIAGYLLFGEIPDVFSFIGGTIIILTAIFLYKHNQKK